MIRLGLVGKKLSHSFSKTFFEGKWEKDKITGYSYDLFELDKINEIQNLLQSENLLGLNITVPYKESVIPFLTEMDESAQKVGAVNVIKITSSNTTGYNSDYYGFQQSMINWGVLEEIKNCLVLGTGGGSKAVVAVLQNMNKEVLIVSRSNSNEHLTYQDLINAEMKDFQLIVNTTPVGMFPNTDSAPELPYSKLTEKHCLYDLVYNPEETMFMKFGQERGAKVKNGLEMLHLQAERSWQIWTS